LRYKIFVRDLHVKMVLYNTGKSLEKVPFTEQSLQEGDLVVTDNLTMN